MDLKLSSRDQMIVAGVLIAIVAVLFVVFLVMPQFNRLKQLDRDLAAAESEIQQAKQLLSARQEAKAAAAQTQAELTRLDNQMPDAPELAALIIDLQNTANESGVEWSQLNPGRPAAVGSFQKMTLSFSVTGTWDDCIDYLRRLNELERSIRVLQLDVTPTKDEGAAVVSTAAPAPPQKVKTQLTLEVYSMPRGGGQTGGAPGAPAPAAQ